MLNTHHDGTGYSFRMAISANAPTMLFWIAFVTAIPLLALYLLERTRYLRLRQYARFPQLPPSLIWGHMKALDEVMGEGDRRRHIGTPARTPTTPSTLNQNHPLISLDRGYEQTKSSSKFTKIWKPPHYSSSTCDQSSTPSAWSAATKSRSRSRAAQRRFSIVCPRAMSWRISSR
jgi:hypothetical protein